MHYTLAEHTAAQTKGLVARDTVKSRLGISGAGEDTFIDELIVQVSGVLAELVGRGGLARREVTEQFPGHGWEDRVLALRPVQELVSVTLDGVAAVLTDHDILHREAGIVRSVLGWTKTARDDWAVRYWGGWLLPGDNQTTKTIHITAASKTFTWASGAPPLVAAGDRFATAGHATAGNDGTYTVVSRTATTVVTEETPAGGDDTGSGDETFVCRNLPYEIEEAAISLCRLVFNQREADPSVKKETVGPVTIEYLMGNEAAAGVLGAFASRYVPALG